jgi:hypothetical protein
MVTSTHYGDLKNWVIKVINSCETTKQLHCAGRLVRFLERRLDDDKSISVDLRFAISRELNDVEDCKLHSLMGEFEQRIKNTEKTVLND